MYIQIGNGVAEWRSAGGGDNGTLARDGAAGSFPQVHPAGPGPVPRFCAVQAPHDTTSVTAPPASH